jgi:hypothetical protein
VLAVAASGADFVTFRLQEPAQAKLVQPRKLKGRWFGAETALDRRTVAAAVRADRES